MPKKRSVSVSRKKKRSVTPTRKKKSVTTKRKKTIKHKRLPKFGRTV